MLILNKRLGQFGILARSKWKLGNFLLFKFNPAFEGKPGGSLALANQWQGSLCFNILTPH